MFQLVLIFGIWINPGTIAYMKDDSLFDHCTMAWSVGTVQYFDHTCEEVSREIRKKLGEGRFVQDIQQSK